MRNTQGPAYVAALLTAAVACTDEAPGPDLLGPPQPPTPAVVVDSVSLSDSSLVTDTAQVSEGNVENLIGATVHEDGTITKDSVVIGTIKADGPVGGTGVDVGVPVQPVGVAASQSVTADRSGLDPATGRPPSGPQFEVWCMVRVTYDLAGRGETPPRGAEYGVGTVAADSRANAA